MPRFTLCKYVHCSLRSLSPAVADLLFSLDSLMFTSLRVVFWFLLVLSFRPDCDAQNSPPMSREQIERTNAQLKEFRDDLAAGRTPRLTDAEKKRVNDFLTGMHDVLAASQKTLLYETDHVKLAVEVRTFAAKHEWARSAPKGGQVYTGKDSALPASVRALKPSSVRVLEDRVEIECGGALHHHGISVFRQLSGGHGTRDLGDGVWYYSEGNRMFNGPPPKI